MANGSKGDGTPLFPTNARYRSMCSQALFEHREAKANIRLLLLSEVRQRHPGVIEQLL